MEAAPFPMGKVLIVAFEGWNDAGEAASGAVRRLRDHLPVTPVAEIDPEDYFDYQFSRPVVSTGLDGTRRILWPGVTFFAPEGDATDVHLLLGTEPSRAWKTFAREILEVVADYDIDLVVFLGAMLADVPHTRPIATGATSESAELRDAFPGVERSQYEGPTGILGVLSEAFEQAGIPSLSVWASVPHYVHNSPSPKATLALLDRLRELVSIEVPREDLVAEAAEWESGIDQLADDDEEMASYIETLERARDTVDAPEATGEAIAEEFEKYLRRHDGDARG